MHFQLVLLYLLNVSDACAWMDVDLSALGARCLHAGFHGDQHGRGLEDAQRNTH